MSEPLREMLARQRVQELLREARRNSAPGPAPGRMARMVARVRGRPAPGLTRRPSCAPQSPPVTVEDCRG
jgi:hypothetical protein